MIYTIIFIVVAFLCTLCVQFYNNKEEILSNRSVYEKVKSLIKIRKNTIATIILSFFVGILLAHVSYYYYMKTFEYTLKILLVYQLLIPIAYMDYKKQIIPNKLVLLGLLIFTVFLLHELLVLRIEPMILLTFYGSGLLLGGGVFVLCAVLTKGSMGMGDIKLYGMLGLLLGWEGIANVMFFSIVLVALYGIVMILRKIVSAKSLVPIGPFTFITVMFLIFLGL